MTESLRCSSEMITTLSIGYTLIQKNKKKKKNFKISSIGLIYYLIIRPIVDCYHKCGKKLETVYATLMLYIYAHILLWWLRW